MMYRLKKQKRVRPIHSKLKPHGQQFSNDDKNKIVTPLFCSSKILFSKLHPCKLNNLTPIDIPLSMADKVLHRDKIKMIIIRVLRGYLCINHNILNNVSYHIT